MLGSSIKMSNELIDLYQTVTSNTDIEDKPQVGFYAKYVKKINNGEHIENFDKFKEQLEFHRFAEGKRPTGCCIIWGCTKKTTRKCSCGCLQFVCKECSFCLL